MKAQKGEGHQVANAYHMLRGAEDESFDSFYGKLNEVVIRKFNLGEKMEDSKIEEDSMIIAGEFPCKGHCHRREQRP